MQSLIQHTWGRAGQFCLVAALALGLPAPVLAQHGGDGDESVSSPPSSALHRFERVVVPEGMVKRLYAAEPLIMDPVAFCLDELNRVYVAESFRQELGVEDNRSQSYWLLDDLAAQTVEDRMAMYEKWAHKRPDGMAHYTKHDDRVRRITDTDGDGVGDIVEVFADRFNHPLDGTGAGLIAFNGDVYYTNIPHLWLLQDQDDDGRAESRTSLQDGFGVRIALRGHDMHGLVWGPDGRLYWSIGDRGYHFTTKEGRSYHSPGTGAVFRCEPDGSNIEVFCHGLRNPQELAFDKYGNLFTGDNNSDAGDRARLVYCVEGGETGWNMNYQTLGAPNLRGPWSEEGIWHTQHPGQPAWTLPPVAHISAGPSGFVYYPGLGLPDRYNDHFFLCDFRGGNDSSQILSFAVEPNGAGFEIVDVHPFVESVLATDVDFGYDGRMYISDWGEGWTGNAEGRLYTVEHPELISDWRVTELKDLIAKGVHTLEVGPLLSLLAHDDMRLRLRAQYALADHDASVVVPVLQKVLAESNHQLARLHALWTLGMIERRDTWRSAGLENPLRVLSDLLRDDDAEMRAQAARLAGDHELTETGDRLIDLLDDDVARVQYFAAISLGKIKHTDAIDPLLILAWDNENEDVYLRHAVSMGLYLMDEPDALLAEMDDPSAAVRLAILLALRKHEDPRIELFLYDEDEFVVTEAARAINDLPIPDAMPALAQLIDRYTLSSVPAAPESDDESGLSVTHKLFPGAAMIAGVAVEDHPVFSTAPGETAILGTWEAPSDIADQFASRLSGTLEVAETGDYRFFIASDDDSALLLGRDGTAASAEVIARVDGWVPPGGWTQSPAQMSEAISLQAGERIYLEARHLEGSGGDHLAVGWQLPDGTFERPIGGGPVVEVEGNNALLRRIVNANFRAGTPAHANALIDLARNPAIPMVIRDEATASLADWIDPSPRDRVIGSYRPLDGTARDEAGFLAVLSRKIPGLIEDTDGGVEIDARRLATQYDIVLDNSANHACVRDASQAAEVRAEALSQLSRDPDEEFDATLAIALESSEPVLRVRARQVIASRSPDEVVPLLRDAVQQGTLLEQQAAIATAASLDRDDARRMLSRLLDSAIADQLDTGLRLDLLSAIEVSGDSTLRTRATAWREQVSASNDPVEPFLICLEGGDADRGRRVFQAHPAASCLRCHTVEGNGGTAGPDLSDVAIRLSSKEMLTSLITPNAVVTEGFGDTSAMPEMAEILTPAEIRDVLAYLSTLRSPPVR